MVDATIGRVALFSIHPRYAEAILDGTKHVEFRRQGLRDDVTHVVIYATAPVQRVVGVFEVAGVDRLSPARAWRKFHRVGGIAKADFDGYYFTAEHAHVIRVCNPERFDTPLMLADLADGLRPPQSYCYLSEDTFQRALDLANAKGSSIGLAKLKALADAATRRVFAAVGV